MKFSIDSGIQVGLISVVRWVAMSILLRIEAVHLVTISAMDNHNLSSERAFDERSWPDYDEIMR